MKPEGVQSVRVSSREVDGRVGERCQGLFFISTIINAVGGGGRVDVPVAAFNVVFVIFVFIDIVIEGGRRHF